MTARSHVYSVLSVVALCSGCIQTSGAMRLELEPVKSLIALDESVVLSTRLIADDGPVCLSRTHHFEIECRRVDHEGETLHGSGQVFLCGTGYVVMLPLWPVLHTISLLDVADTQERYMTLDADSIVKGQLVFAPSERYGERFLAVAKAEWGELTERINWEPGIYEIKVKLVNEVVGFYARPLFWTPYRPAVEATVRIEVGGSARPNVPVPVPEGVKYETTGSP